MPKLGHLSWFYVEHCMNEDAWYTFFLVKQSVDVLLSFQFLSNFLIFPMYFFHFLAAYCAKAMHWKISLSLVLAYKTLPPCLQKVLVFWQSKMILYCFITFKLQWTDQQNIVSSHLWTESIKMKLLIILERRLCYLLILTNIE